MPSFFICAFSWVQTTDPFWSFPGLRSGVPYNANNSQPNIKGQAILCCTFSNVYCLFLCVLLGFLLRPLFPTLVYCLPIVAVISFVPFHSSAWVEVCVPATWLS